MKKLSVYNTISAIVAVFAAMMIFSFPASAQDTESQTGEPEPPREEITEEFTLPEELGAGIRVDNERHEIYFVPQNYSVLELGDVLYESVPDAYFDIYAENLIYDEYLVSGAKVDVYSYYTEAYAEYTVTVKGDVTGDGKTAASDARTALRLAVGLDEEYYDTYLRAFDLDCDDAVTGSDARTLLRVAVRLELLGRDIGVGSIRFYGENSIYLRNPGLADVINNADLTPKTSLEVKNLRNAADTSWRIYTSDKDVRLIEDILKQFPKDATNLEKIFSVYKYIQGQFEYASGDLYTKIWSLSPLEAILNEHLAQCLQYNGAMAQVLAYMGYDVKLIEGMRGQGDYVNDEVKSFWNHYWTELYIDGSTYLIEVGEPTKNWSGAFMVLYSDSDGRYLYYNAEKEGYSFLK